SRPSARASSARRAWRRPRSRTARSSGGREGSSSRSGRSSAPAAGPPCEPAGDSPAARGRGLFVVESRFGVIAPSTPTWLPRASTRGAPRTPERTMSLNRTILTASPALLALIGGAFSLGHAAPDGKRDPCGCGTGAEPMTPQELAALPPVHLAAPTPPAGLV